MFKPTALALSIATGLVCGAASAATISGKVTDENGKAIEGAQVQIEGSRQFVTTDAQGQYTLSGIDLDDVHIHVYSTNHVHGDEDLGAVTKDTTVNFTLLSAGIENILITATALQTSVLESVTPVTVLGKDELARRQAPTLGETLKYVPGVHSTYFGPVAASPVIRGNDGPRVKIVQNSLDVSDVSRVGPDHNVASSSSGAVQVEVLRGPATLQYGSGAIGGVVNVVDNRIPRSVPESVEGSAEVSYSTVDEGKYGKVDVTGGSGNVAFHFDGYKRKTENADIPGFASVEPDDDEPYGILENSAMDTTDFVAGLSWVDDEGYFGFSVENLENEYGVPGHHHHHEEEGEHEGEEEHEHEDEHGEEEGVLLDVDMTRYQAAGEWYSPFEGITSVKFAGAYTEYEHAEIEDGAIGTSFSNDTTEFRLSASHENIAGWHGVVGLQYNLSEYAASGAEAFTPSTDTDSFALFVLEQKQFGDVTVELGARIERTELDADDTEIDAEFSHADEDHEDEHHDDEEHEDEHHDEDEHDEHEDEHHVYQFDKQSFTNVSLSAGLNWEYQPGSSVAVTLSRSERAPSQQELYASGEHIATQTFELGLVFDLDDEELGEGLVDAKEEVSTNLDITFRKFDGDFGYTFSAFYTQVDDYIYQSNTGLVVGDEHGHEDEHDAHEGEDDHDEHEDEMGHEDEHAHGDEESLPVFYFRQADADLYGFEFEAYVDVTDEWRITGYGDYIRAKLDNEDLPRIPPLRLGSNLAYEKGDLRGELGFVWYDEQDRVAQFETATDAYTLVHFNVEYDIHVAQTDITLFAKGDNLTDEEARVHTSFVKDQAPLPGRNFTLGVRANF